MRCPRCEHDNPASAKFCGECGARLETTCPACQAVNPLSNKFCHQCGLSLIGGSGAGKFASPHSYTPEYLVERILVSKAALEGERKQVTVLFADVKGSMELLADRDLEETRKLLDAVLERMMEAVHRYEGTVNQVMGDGIMALFGAPLAHEDHAVRACYAALAMQSAMQRYTEEVRRSLGIEVQIRVGLNSGEVVVRAIGNDLHMDYSAIGQTTHLAARMEQLARPGSVRLTADTLRLAEGFVQVTRLGPVPVRGVPAPVEVFELVGAAPTRTRLQAAAARGLTRFIGRQAELEVLSQALDRARTGHGQIVALVGEPGVGKSRLFWEFTRSHRTDGWLVLESRSVSYGKASAYFPVIDLLKAYFQIEDRDDPRKIRETLTGKLLTLDRAWAAMLPIFLALMDVPSDDADWQALDPPQRRQRTLDAVKQVLIRESQVQPLLLVLEDLHWIDSETQAFLDSLVESLPTARILLLVNYRPEYQHGWGSKTYYMQLRIDPLSAENAEELLDTLLGGDPALSPLKLLLIDRTERNPFFLEESVRALAETKLLVGEPQAYRLSRPLQAIEVPATVQAVLAARIDRLPPDEKRLLQSAAVIGKDVPFALLQAIADQPEHELRRGLAHLQAGEFLYEASLFPDLEYTFKHALTHEVAYGNLLQERRRALHARITDAIEALHADRLAEQFERLAHHASRGQLWDKALTYSRQAGIKAASRSANREAVTLFEQALGAQQHLPESRDRLTQAIDLRVDLRNPLYSLGEFERLFDYLREAEKIAETLGDEGRLGQVSCYIAEHFRLLGDRNRAIAAGRRALSIAEALEDFPLQVMANFYLGLVFTTAGDYRQATDCFTRNVGALTGDLMHHRFGLAGLASVLSRTWLVWCLAELGEFPRAIVLGDEGVRIAEAAGQPWSLAAAHFGIGGLYLRKGKVDKAIPLLERGLRVCQTGDVPLLFHIIASTLGCAYAYSGRLAEALPILEQALEQAGSMRVAARRSLEVSWLSEAYLIAGRVEEAIQLAGRAIDLSRRHSERGHEAWCLRLLGEIASRGDPPDVEMADAHYHEAMALGDELGMRPLVAHCHLGLGRSYRRTNDRKKAAELLATAAAQFRAMDMQLWLERAEAELRMTPLTP